MKKIFFFISIFLFTMHYVLCPLLFASNIQFEVTVDRNKIALGEALQLSLSFHGTQNVSAPSIDKIEGFDVRYLGPSTMVSIVNGVVTSSITHIFTLVPLKTGIFTIGSFSVEVQGKTLTSKPITIEVISAPSGGQPYSRQQAQEEPSPARIDSQELKDRIFLILSTGKRKAYLNEIMPLTIKLYVNRLGVRDIQFPVIETNDFSIEKFAPAPEQYRQELGGVLYDVIEFTTDMFAMKPGDFTLGPAKLKCNIVVRQQAQRRRGPFDDDFFGGFFNDDIFEDFFGRYEAYPIELKSAELPITVLPLPQEGKPEGFDGALGNFQLEVDATPLQVKAGDPITLRMTVKGEGNFDSVKPPKLQSKDGFKVYDPQVKQSEFEKIFEQVLIPESEKVTYIPQINFSFFNTKTGQYEVLTHNPIPITVSKTEERQAELIELPQGSQIKLVQKEELGRDIIYLKSSPGKFRKVGRYLYQSLGFWCLQILSFIIFLSIFLFNLRQQRLSTDRRYARRLQAPRKAKKGMREIDVLLRKGKTETFFDAVFKTIREYLADRFHLPVGGITAITIEELAKEKGIASEVLDKIKKIFSDCDMARYAPSQFGQKQLEDIFQSLKEIIDYLEKGQGARRIAHNAKRVAFLFTMLYALCSMHCAPYSFAQETSTFNRADAYYEQANYDEAIKQYNSILESGYESGNLYYNLGNCYFKKGELGRAILNYEKARRLIPQDLDLESNYNYTCSLIKSGTIASKKSLPLRVVNNLFDKFSVDGLTLLLGVCYILILGSILINRFFKPFKKYTSILVVFMGLFFIVGFVGLRGKITLLNKEAIVIVGQVDAKFEPMDKATAYFTLYEGMKVEVISCKDSWYKIRRKDNKSGWVENIALAIF